MRILPHHPASAPARTLLLAALAVLAAGCATSPPERQADLCEVFEQHPDWYDMIWAIAGSG